ncbi:MAG TPA: histidine--tRNA ligase [Bacteroidia bacterium]|nr:histidine--tRNA ligase [Bacteroidia bacterium]
MAVQKPSIPSGTRDFGPVQVQKRKHILNTLEQVFRTHGYMPLETPAMENLSSLEGKYGEEGDKLLFRILNSGDAFKRIKEDNPEATLGNFDFRTSMVTEKGLRYDLTVPFARYVVMNRNDITLPFKRYQMQPVWRADRPQKGRYREFWQCDADVVGSDSLLNEADLILIYLEAFKKLGLDVVVRLNNRKILEGMAALHGERSRFIEFATIIDKLDKIGYDKVMEELHAAGFAIQALTASEKIFSIRTDEFPNPYHNPIVLGALQDLGNDFEKYNIDFGLKGIEELAKVYNMIPQEWQAQVMIDPLLARGLSYYTGCIVEVVANEGTLKSSIGGGGRYDNLTGVFGLQGVSGVGISFGLDRIYDILEELKRYPEEVNQPTHTKVVFCCFDEASQLYATEALNKVRQAGIPAEVYPDLKKIGKQLDYANALKIPFAIMIGGNERSSGILSFKDLNSGTQESLTLETIIEKLKG